MAAQISPLPSVPSRQDPTNFNDRADAFLGALPTFQSEANALSTEVNTRADNVQAANNAVLAATNITKWVSGTTYAQGAVVWSPGNGLGYRRITAAGSGTTDPALDTTNYKQVNGTGDVSTTGDQSIAGVKTFVTRLNLSEPLFVSNGGTGANNAVSAFGILKQAATTASSGVLEIATNSEIQQGIAGAYAITAETFVLNNVSRATAISSTSGTAVDFINIPSWAKRITVMLSGVSTSGTSVVLIQLGTSSGVETSGYLAIATAAANAGTSTSSYANGFALDLGGGNLAASIRHGAVTISNLTGNTWVASGNIGLSSATYTCATSGSKVTAGVIDRIRITTVNGTDTFDAGSVNILWE